MTYTITYSPDAELHLKVLTARERAIIFDKIKDQLAHDANVTTRNRKRMRPNKVALWELRIGDLRAYYDIDDSKETVIILAVGVKEHNRVRIGKEILEL